MAICLTALLTGCSSAPQGRTNDSANISSQSSSVIEQNSPSGEMYDKLLDALLKDRLKIAVVRENGGSNPCEPQEPYFRLSIQKKVSEPHWDEVSEKTTVKEKWEDSDIAQGITVIERTGMVEMMDVCLE